MPTTLQERKASYKAPPASIRDRGLSQEARRKKALEEQKRRRAERFDSSRQLDLFANLNLGPTDDDDDDGDDAIEPVREGVAQYASILSNTSTLDSTPFSPARPSGTSISPNLSNKLEESTGLPTTFGKKRGKNKRKNKSQASRSQSQPQRPSKWADKCMYAELLEMTEDLEMSYFDVERGDGIPEDIESGWVAVTPVPAGKRCLAITHAASGLAGAVPNTTLRSRVLGKCLMSPFPSSLPPHTVLDCILDESWRDNGILHVLDVLKWKGQDIADCETPFRFWWRDTRLAELPFLPPPKALSPQEPSSSSTPSYQFRYPTTLVPIPYRINFTLLQIADELIPLTRTTRHIPISIPLQADSGAMALDGPPVQLCHVMAPVTPDGLLLYVAHATYEPGTSPLSTWVSNHVHAKDRDANKEKDPAGNTIGTDGPLDVFERLINRRLARGRQLDTAMEIS